ncbi:MAG: hypothetical protein P8Y70_15430 [Candidatus Lokiarchaeota archaeon]
MNPSKEAKDLYEKARKYIDGMRYEKAIETLNQILIKAPNDVKAICDLCLVHARLGFKELSEEKVFLLAKKALKLNDQLPLDYLSIPYDIFKERN